jgi:hypothetical protein
VEARRQALGDLRGSSPVFRLRIGGSERRYFMKCKNLKQELPIDQVEHPAFGFGY